jgi:hypothetical protein
MENFTEKNNEYSVLVLMVNKNFHFSVAPSIKIDKKFNIVGKYGSTQLTCETSGNPQPKVLFFRDIRNQSEIKSGPNTRISFIPHSTVSDYYF